MPELIHLQFGALPWQPAEDAELVEVFDRHDRPTCGLIEQSGRTFLFDCIEGHAWDVNVWAYVEVSDDQVATLADAEDAEFAKVVDRVLASERLVAALAVGDRLEAVTVVDASQMGSNVYAGIMDAALTNVERRSAAAKKLRDAQLVS